MVPHAFCYVRTAAQSQSQKWLSHRGQAHGRPRKAWKARRVLPPKLPTQSTHTQCPAPPAHSGVTRSAPGVNKNDIPSARDRVRQPVARVHPPPSFPWPAASTTTINNQQLKMHQPPATQQSTTIRLEGREGRRAKSRLGVVRGQLFVIFPNKCMQPPKQKQQLKNKKIS